jgi:RNA polymerase sigma factor (sigma-70 family)
MRPARQPAVEADGRHYEQHRAAVVGLLRARFGSAFSDVDREDLYHEAWTGVLEHQRRGQPTPDLLGLLKTIAWRRGRDRLRNISADPSDPIDGVLARAFDNRPPPDEQVLQRLDVELCHQLIESLGDRQRTILKLRCECGLSPAEIQDALGISRKAYEKQLTRAFKRLAAELGDVENGSWRDRQRELLLACEAGTATPEERARAKRLVERDPACRAMLRRIRGAACLLPLPALLRRVLRLHPAAGVAGEGVAQIAASGGGGAIGGAALAKLAAVCTAGLTVAGGVVAGMAGHDRTRSLPARTPTRSAVVAPAPAAAPVMRVTTRRVSPRVAVRSAAVRPVEPTASAPPPRRVVERPAVTEVAPPPPAAAKRAVPAGDGSQEFGP